MYFGGCVGLLPGANQHAGVDYWRPVWKVLAAGLACAWLVLGLRLACAWLALGLRLPLNLLGRW